MDAKIEYIPTFSYNKYLQTIFNKDSFRNKVKNAIKGIVGNSKNAPNQIDFLKLKITNYNEKIVDECNIVGKAWNGIGCDINRTKDLYKIMTNAISHCAETNNRDAFDLITEECEIFAEYILIIAALQEEIEKLQPKKQIDKISPEVNEEQIKQAISELFTVAVKRKHDGTNGKHNLIDDIFNISRDCNGAKFFAMACVLYKRKYYGKGFVHNRNEWVDKLKNACGLPNLKTENYKSSSKAVKSYLSVMQSHFYYLCLP